MNEKKESWLKAIFQYANGQKGRMTASVLLSVVSVIAGLMPFFCIYRRIRHGHTPFSKTLKPVTD